MSVLIFKVHILCKYRNVWRTVYIYVVQANFWKTFNCRNRQPDVKLVNECIGVLL